jgi:hypothetical protein
MLITVNPVYEWQDDKLVLVSHDGQYEAEPTMLFDRSATAESKSQMATAGATAGGAANTASQLQGNLIPFYQQEMNTQHEFTPGQEGEMYTAAEAGAGGATGADQEEERLNAGRTGNTAGYSSNLGQIAQGRAKANAAASEGIAAQDVMGAKEMNQAGAAGEQGLYGANTNTMLSSMGLQGQDVQNQLKSDSTGWFQNLTGFMGALGQDAQGAAKLGMHV